MSLDDLLRSEWFYRSPGPISLIYYGTIILLGARILHRKVEYRRWSWLNSLTDSFFVNGFIVLVGDIIWITACATRFLGSYPIETFQVLAVFGRNFAGLLLCYLLTAKIFKQKIVSFKRTTFLAYVVLGGFFAFNFAVARDPAWTDWTLAIRWERPTIYILKSFLWSYGVGKAVGLLTFWTWWN